MATIGIVEFNIPFAINLPNDVYVVNESNFSCEVMLELKIPKTNPSGWTGGARVHQDRFGHTNYSHTRVKFNFNNPQRFSVQLDDQLQQFSITVVNKILDACRWVSDHYFNRNIVLLDIGSFSVKLYNNKNQELPGSLVHIPGAFSFGGEGPITKPQIVRIKEILKNNEEFPLDIELIKNEEDHIRFDNNRLACIDIQSAVELIISRVIQKHLEAKAKTEQEIEEILKSRLDDLLRPYLIDATESGILQTTEYQEWRVSCYKLRNDVVHKNKIPTNSEAKKAVQKGVEFIKYLKKFV